MSARWMDFFCGVTFPGDAARFPHPQPKNPAPLKGRIVRWTVWGVTAILATAGCEEGPIPIETAPVSGTATYQGKPLEDYRVFFYAMGHPAQEPASGLIGDDGRFTLSVREPGDGAIVGQNQVFLKFDPPVTAPANDAPIVLPPPKIKIPAHYLDRDKSGITVEVPPEGIQDYKLELE